MNSLNLILLKRNQNNCYGIELKIKWIKIFVIKRLKLVIRNIWIIIFHSESRKGFLTSILTINDNIYSI